MLAGLCVSAVQISNDVSIHRHHNYIQAAFCRHINLDDCLFTLISIDNVVKNCNAAALLCNPANLKRPQVQRIDIRSVMHAQTVKRNRNAQRKIKFISFNIIIRIVVDPQWRCCIFHQTKHKADLRAACPCRNGFLCEIEN